MSKKNNDSIESFFRKAVSQQDTSFMEQDWKKMEKLLDQDTTSHVVTKTRTLVRVAVAITILSGISIGLLLFETEFINPDYATKNLSTETQAAAAVKALEKPKIENATASLVSPPVESAPTSATGSDPAFSNLTSETKANSNTKKDVNFFRERESGEKKIPGLDLADRNARPKDPARTSVGNQSDQNTRGTPDGFSKAEIVPSPENDSKVSGDTHADQTFDATTPATTITDAGSERKKEPIDNVLLTTNAEESKEENDEKQSPVRIPSRWNIALVVAPDFSTAGLKHYTTPGKSYGLLVGYNFLKRLSVSTGIFRSSKIYEGYGDQYQPPQGYWQRRTNGVIPDEINGTCEVFEIPFLLQYTVIQKNKSRAYATAGITTYQITSEKYQYSFNSPNPGAANSWSTNNSTTYPFNIGQLSIGYERQIARQITLGVEPFLKVPFRGMGWSNVDIFSTGAFVNLRYRFFKNEIMSKKVGSNQN